MVINHIRIDYFGRISHFEISLTDHLNFLETVYIDEISLIISFLLNNKPKPPISSVLILPNTKIVATVTIKKIEYQVVLLPNEGSTDLCITAFDSGGNDKTKSYFSELSHCIEEDELTFFNDDRDNAQDRFHAYLEEERCDVKESLAIRTEGRSKTRTFRRCLRETLINLEDDESMPTDRNGKQKQRCIYYLNLLSFWDKFHQIQNMHHIKKPIVISKFLECFEDIGESFAILNMIKRSDRQVIFLLPKNKKKMPLWNMIIERRC